MKYFFDNCISYRFADMLRAIEVEATSLRSEFSECVQDTEFLRALKNNHDVYITYDHKQKRREDEAAAIKESGLTALWLGPFWGKKQFWDQAQWLITHWRIIDNFANSAVPGTCAEIKANGKSMSFNL